MSQNTDLDQVVGPVTAISPSRGDHADAVHHNFRCHEMTWCDRYIVMRGLHFSCETSIHSLVLLGLPLHCVQ